MRLLKPATLLLFAISAVNSYAVELYREDFTANGVVSKVGWSVWHKDATSGLVIDDTAKTIGDRAAVFTSYAGKPISHLYSSINLDNSPSLIFTNEFTFDLAAGSISSFEIGRFMDGDTLDKLQLALRVNGQWYVYGPQIIDAANSSTTAYNNSEAPATSVTFSSSNWTPVSLAVGAAPAEGASGTLPTGLVDGVGFYLTAFNSSNPGYGTTRERIDYLTIQGTAAVPEPAAFALFAGLAGLIPVALRRRRIANGS